MVGIALLLKWKTRWAELGAALVLLSFAGSMTLTLPLQDQFAYSVFVLSAGMFVMATRPSVTEPRVTSRS
ncbi:hypothetical protein [Kibdelosporangium philippinense]|uniref:hypothetical protein n=1 Tax=Kibdelosporangium philippinense TaxID=211113 RepID=UPI003556DA22